MMSQWDEHPIRCLFSAATLGFRQFSSLITLLSLRGVRRIQTTFLNKTTRTGESERKSRD